MPPPNFSLDDVCLDLLHRLAEGLATMSLMAVHGRSVRNFNVHYNFLGSLFHLSVYLVVSHQLISSPDRSLIGCVGAPPPAPWIVRLDERPRLTSTSFLPHDLLLAS